MSEARQKLLNMVKEGAPGYWIEHVSIEGEDRSDLYCFRRSGDCCPLFCYPKEGVWLSAIKYGLSDEEIMALPVCDVTSERGKYLIISVDEMVCLDRWAWLPENEENYEINRKRYSDYVQTIESIDPGRKECVKSLENNNP